MFTSGERRGKLYVLLAESLEPGVTQEDLALISQSQSRLKVKADLTLWHQRLCHYKAEPLYNMVKLGTVEGVERTTPQGTGSSSSPCSSCVEGSLH